MLKNIYVIEDDANILFGLQAKLSLGGYKVTVNQGNYEMENIKKEIKEKKPDLLILDILLPRMDGFELIKYLKADLETSRVPIFIFSNLSDDDSQARGINLGAEQYFIKSDLGIDQLVEKIGKIFKNRESDKI